MSPPVSLDLGGCTHSLYHLVIEEEQLLLALKVCNAIVLEHCVYNQVKEIRLRRLEHQKVTILVLKHEDVLGCLHLAPGLHLPHNLSLADFTVSNLKDLPGFD